MTTGCSESRLGQGNGIPETAEHRRGWRVAPPRNGGELVFQIGTAYFGCRDEHGRFSLDRLKELPGAKVSAEIATARGVPEGEDCISPSRHAEFSDTDSLLDLVELLAAETGLPVGIKSAVGVWPSGTSSPRSWRRPVVGSTS
jgi:glutamate synthase domain-containing protein 2